MNGQNLFLPIIFYYPMHSKKFLLINAQMEGNEGKKNDNRKDVENGNGKFKNLNGNALKFE